MHGEQDGRRCLSHLHTLTLYIVRKTCERVLHSVLDEHLRHVEVRSDAERYGDIEIPITRRLTAHIKHVLDPVYLLLERGRDGPGNGLGRRAGVYGGYLHRGRHDLRILGHRKREECRKTQRNQKDVQDRREARMVNKKVSDAHGNPTVNSRRAGSPHHGPSPWSPPTRREGLR